MYRGIAIIKCANCDRTVKDHYWGRVKAHDTGWLIQKNGTAYCPDHLPDWVEGWRKDRERPADRED